MEIFVSVFMGGWMILFGIIFMVALNREYSKYDVEEKKGGKK